MSIFGNIGNFGSGSDDSTTTTTTDTQTTTTDTQGAFGWTTNTDNTQTTTTTNTQGAFGWTVEAVWATITVSATIPEWSSIPLPAALPAPQISPVSSWTPVANSLADQQRERRGRIIGGNGATMGPIYGAPTVEGMPDVIRVAGLYLYIRYLFGLPVYSIDSAWISGKPIGELTHELHPGGITESPLLVDAFAGSATPYVVANDGSSAYACLVVRITLADLSAGLPGCVARVRGRVLSEPVAIPPPPTYANNAALVLADFLSNDDFGCALTVDIGSVQAARAAYPDFTCNLQVQGVGGGRNVWSWVEVMKAHALCDVHIIGDTAYLVPDAPRAGFVDFTITASMMIETPVETFAPTASFPNYLHTRFTHQWYGAAGCGADADREIVSERIVNDDRQQRLELPGCLILDQAKTIAAVHLQRRCAQPISMRLVLLATQEVLDEVLPGRYVSVVHPLYSLAGIVDNVAMDNEYSLSVDVMQYSGGYYDTHNVYHDVRPIPLRPECSVW